MVATRPGDDPTPRAGEGGPRRTATQLASDPAFTGTYAQIDGAGRVRPDQVITQPLAAARNITTPGDRAKSITTSWSDVDTNWALDITIPAQAGDWVEVTFDARYSTGADIVYVDLVSVAGSARRSWSQNAAPSNTTTGAWSGAASTSGPVSIRAMQQVKSTDLYNGMAAFRVTWRSATTTTTHTLTDSSGSPWRMSVKNFRTDRVAVLSPSLSWEQGVVQEPNIWYANGKWHMIYTGGWATQSLGYASAPTPLGPWTKNATAILGNGVGGQSGSVGRSSILVENGTVYVFYATSPATAALYVATAPVTAPTSLTKTGGSVFTPSGNATNVQNTSVVSDGGTYRMIFESNDSGNGNVFRMGYATASAVAGPYTQQQFTLSTLAVIGTAAGGMYGGPCLIKRGANSWSLWYHACQLGNQQLPTDIYQATSTDLTTWTSTTYPLIGRRDFREVDQTADIYIVTDPASSLSYAFWSAMDNTTPAGYIMASVPQLMQITP